MTVTSFSFLVLLLAGMLLYYLVPRRAQWIILLCLSLVYYYYAAVPYTMLYLLVSTAVAYISTNLLYCKKIKERGRLISGIAIAGVLINVLIWFILKGSSFWTVGMRLFQKAFPAVHAQSSIPVVAALGMGYYTSQVIGYILDCYWGISVPQKNPFKLFLFVCFFPQLTVGPISKYSQLQGLYEQHKFSYQNLCFGCQRILWGFFKKLVISDRVAILVNSIWADAETYNGLWPWIAVLLYPIEIYSDFSGCVDIVLGAAELFDIKLPENFKNPFMARTVQEFWQRWHITLGAWAKDYVYYPVLKSKFLISLRRWTKKRFSKRLAKLIPWTFGMGVLWFVMGFWHGSLRHIIGVSAWYWLILVLGEIFQPIFERCRQGFHIEEECFSWRLFQRIRTYLIFSIGSVFFSAKSFRGALRRYDILFHSVNRLNPWVLFDGSIQNLGVTWIDINLIIFGVYLLCRVAYLREIYEYARIWMKKQILPYRWLIWIVLFFCVIIYGLYGPGYDASSFIYQGF